MTSLYVHIPFCQKKCFYCSFVVTIGQDDRINAYLDGLDGEAKRYQNTELRTIYVGGGTPTHMGLGQLKKLFSILKQNFRFRSDCEWTLEANPEGLDLDKAKLLKDYGVNRVSLGVQSLNDRYLKYLGRTHDSHQAIKAFENLRQAGFTNINLDLMYSFPGQTSEEIKEDVAVLVGLGSEHLSLYTLTIEDESRFYARRLELEDGAVQAQQYSLVVSLLKQTAFRQYEISNFARPGFQSRHNLNYWQGGEYIGLGVGAHSHLSGERSWNVSRFQEYLSLTRQHKRPVAGKERLGHEDRFMELFLVGLRMNEGLRLKDLGRKLGCALPSFQRSIVDQMIEQGLLAQEEDHLKATDTGRLVLDEIAARLI